MSQVTGTESTTRGIRRDFLAAVASACILAASAPAQAANGIELEFLIEVRSTGCTQPIALSQPADGTGRLFVVCRRGRVLIYAEGSLRSEPFLDISSRVFCCENERGLLDLAFHPDFVDNGQFFVSYNDLRTSDSIVSRFTVSADPNRAEASSEVRFLRVPKPEPQHNVGRLTFGPDGHLYVGAADGGLADNGEDLGTLLGKILRLDVDQGDRYEVPVDNPFTAEPGALDEIWVYGLRNPWRFTFDRETGDLFIGDVGGDSLEEVNFLGAGSGGGANYGWPTMEGSSCTDGGSACNQQGALTLPILEYPHAAGEETCNAVVGGFRYRGPPMPTLPRFYLFADFCTGQIWGARRNRQGRWVTNELLRSDLQPASFGQDAEGNLYLVNLRGGIHRIVGRYLLQADFESRGFRGWSARKGQPRIAESGLRRSGHALEVPLTGTPRPHFLKSNRPSRETTLELSFLLSLRQARLDEAEIEIVRLSGDGSGGHTWLTLNRVGAASYLNLWTRTEAGGSRFLGRSRVPARRTVRIALDWMHASSPDSPDGEVAVRHNGKLRIQADDLDNHASFVSDVLLGLPSGSSGAVAGSLLFDDYRSTP